MEQNKKRRALEIGKDVLIVLLACSALWLAAHTQLGRPLHALIREEEPRASSGYEQGEIRAEAALPMAMAVNIPGEMAGPDGETALARYGVQYDQEGCQTLFQQVAGPLVEALSSAGAPERITREQWEEVLHATPGVYMDFQGDIPMRVLTGWLVGEERDWPATVRRLVLSVWEDGVALCYHDQKDGSYYRCQSEVADPVTLMDTLSAWTGNGALFAFESEHYAQLAPDTLLLETIPAQGTYTASNPVGGGQADLEEIIQDLGFSLNTTSFYSADEQVARNEDDSVRLSDRGVLVYTAGENSGRYTVAGARGMATLEDSVELCRQLVMTTLGARCGEARLYLMSAEATQTGWEIEFGYQMNGVPVRLERGYAARFLVEGEQVTQFTLHFRNYVSGGDTASPLPLRQAIAALVAEGLEGEELVLIYPDSGGDTLTAGWAVRAGGAGEE